MRLRCAACTSSAVRSRLGNALFDPRGERIQHLASDFRILPSRTGRHMEGMIGILEQSQGCARTKPFDKSPEQLLVGKLVAVSLQKQHRHVDLEQMAAAIVGRPSSRMQREAEKGETLNARQGRFRLRLRRHPAAERFAAGNQGQSRGQPSGLGDGGADSGMGEAGRSGRLEPRSMYGN